TNAAHETATSVAVTSGLAAALRLMPFSLFYLQADTTRTRRSEREECLREATQWFNVDLMSTRRAPNSTFVEVRGDRLSFRWLRRENPCIRRFSNANQSQRGKDAADGVRRRRASAVSLSPEGSAGEGRPGCGGRRVEFAGTRRVRDSAKSER